jgi:hypothetical protein
MKEDEEGWRKDEGTKDEEYNIIVNGISLQIKTGLRAF